MLRSILVSVMLLLSLGGKAWAAAAEDVDPLADPPRPAHPGQTAAASPEPASRYRVEPLVGGFQSPRSLVALPDGNLLVVEGHGVVRVLSPDGELSSPMEGLPDMIIVSGRGLNDLTLDRDFADNRWVYFTYTSPPPSQAGGERTERERRRALRRGEGFQDDKLARARLSEDLRRFEEVEVIAPVYGRRLQAAADGRLYVTTMGFTSAMEEVRPAVQKLTSPYGKVLRFNPNGSIPSDNPFAGRPMLREEIYSYGHRDPDGAAVHPETGALWVVEHGPMGGDELNVIRPGLNYGWPVISYGKNYDGSSIGMTQRFGMEQPVYYWYPSVAPSGLMFYTGELFPAWQGNLLVGTMSPTQGRFLSRLILDGERVVGEERLLQDMDRRIRDIAQGPEGAIYVLTDSENNAEAGRQFAGEVLRIVPESFSMGSTR